MKTLDKDAILDRLGGSLELFEAVCERFVNLLPGQMTAMGAAIQASDSDTVGRTAHRLRGSVGYFDSQPVLSIVGELEAMCKSGNFEAGQAATLYQRLEEQMEALVAELKTLR